MLVAQHRKSLLAALKDKCREDSNCFVHIAPDTAVRHSVINSFEIGPHGPSAEDWDEEKITQHPLHSAQV